MLFEIISKQTDQNCRQLYSTAHGQLNTRLRHARAVVTYAVYTLLLGLVCAAVRGQCCGYCELVQRRSIVKCNCNVAKTASLRIVFIHAHCACVFRVGYVRRTREGHAGMC